LPLVELTEIGNMLLPVGDTSVGFLGGKTTGAKVSANKYYQYLWNNS